jgi:hypothetical protein
MVLDNHHELWKQEQELRKRQAENDANKLRIQRVTMEHKQSGQRYTYQIMGWKAEKDFQDFMVQFHIQNSQEAPKMSVVEQTGFLHTVDFVPKDVRKQLVFSWLPELSTKVKDKIKAYLNKE